MRIAVIADTFPPHRSSGAVQLRDLCREFVKQGHSITIMLPNADQLTPWLIEEIDGVKVVRLKALATRDMNYARRTFAEFMMPYLMMWNLKRSPLENERWDGVVWYSPSIFHGPLAKFIKSQSKCRAYLIIRDIFPEWAVDMDLIKRGGLVHKFFSAVANYQYSVADIIGVQTSGNLAYFSEWMNGSERRIEVLHNWIADTPIKGSSLALKETQLAGRKVFVYAGNIGVAQGMDILLDLADEFKERSDIGFLFVGRGTFASEMKVEALKRNLNNILFHSEIDPDEIPALYAQCAIGLLALDQKHKSHNIPGKFLTYLQSGLPVLATVNYGNDIANIIRQEGVGRVDETGSVKKLKEMAIDILNNMLLDDSLNEKCRALYLKMFKPESAVDNIVRGLKCNKQSNHC